MKTPESNADDERLDAVLNRGISRTSASFERRFEAMRTRLGSPVEDEMPTRQPIFRRIHSWQGWAALAASLALVLGLWQFNSERRDVSPQDYDILEGSMILQNEDLITLNHSLESTLELFDDELLEFLIAVSNEHYY